MNTVFNAIGLYLLLGVLALALLDMLTGRIRLRLRDASYDTQNKLVTAGSPVGSKMAIAVTVAALWLFWPVAIYGALTSRRKKNNDTRNEQIEGGDNETKQQD